MKPNAKNLILGLLLETKDEPLSVRDAITAGALFGISENNVRVALVRLSAGGQIEAAGRGSYQLGPAASELAEDVAHWRAVEQRLRAWDGDYIAVHCGALGRSDRAALRTRDRALHLLGLKELERGLYLRPDNLKGGVDAVRKRLYTLGLETGASVFLAESFDADRDARARRLWDGKALTASYRRSRQQLERWLDRAGELEADVAAREAYLLGDRAIRQVVFDPLLPAPFVDTGEREAFFECVRRFDREGRALWQRLFKFSAGVSMPLSLQAERRAH